MPWLAPVTSAMRSRKVSDEKPIGDDSLPPGHMVISPVFTEKLAVLSGIFGQRTSEGPRRLEYL